MKKLLLSVIVSLVVGISNLSYGQVSGYTFAQTAPAFPPAIGGTTHTTGTTDYATYSNIPLGFTFCYNGVNYTAISICNDGYIVMGSSIFGTTTPISSGSEHNVIAALAADLQGLATGSLKSQMTGVAPNRKFTVQWLHYEKWLGTDDYSFQIVLSETSNQIQIYYTATTIVASNTFQVGLSGTTNADFNNRTKANATNWTVSSAGVANTDVMSTGGNAARSPNGCFTWSAPAACSGAPAAGTATSPGSVCSGVSFSIPLTGYTGGCGMSYQWQSASAIGGPYTDVAGQTSTTFTGTQSATTYYRCISTCSNGGPFTATSSVATVSMSAPSACYCSSTATSTSDMDVTNITFGTINNTSATVSLTGSQGNATGTAGMYSNWTASTVPVPLVMQGSSNAFSVTIGGTAYNHRVDVYIDFNQDGDFADAGESLPIFAYANPLLPNTTASSISIPLTATPGVTRMRVVCVESSSTSDCGTYTWGETEDYNINITAAAACAGTPTGGTTVSSINPICPGGSTVLSVTGSSIATGLTYQWQSSVDN